MCASSSVEGLGMLGQVCAGHGHNNRDYGDYWSCDALFKRFKTLAQPPNAKWRIVDVDCPPFFLLILRSSLQTIQGKPEKIKVASGKRATYPPPIKAQRNGEVKYKTDLSAQ